MQTEPDDFRDINTLNNIGICLTKTLPVLQYDIIFLLLFKLGCTTLLSSQTASNENRKQDSTIPNETLNEKKFSVAEWKYGKLFISLFTPLPHHF